MMTILQIALSVAVNLVPAGGVVFRGWSPATALALYWCENLMGSVLIAVRIAVHRRLTRKRGHYRIQMNVTDGEGRPVATTYLGEFLTASLGFTLVHGVFLAALLRIVVKDAPDRVQVVQGLRWMAAAQVAALLLDLIRIREWRFAELKKGADSLIGRIGLIHFSIMGGMLVAAFNSRPKAFFAVFGTLKALADVAALIPYKPECPAEAPRWFIRLAKLFGQDKHWKTGQDIATWWRETTLLERARAAEDERRIEPAHRS